MVTASLSGGEPSYSDGMPTTTPALIADSATSGFRQGTIERRDLRPITHAPDEHPRGDYGAGDQILTLALRRTSPVGESP